ncbi:hypothetical protein GGI20_000655 [Coemansia sp. BCRC 34301]|nr:hypothetical protein GGI20_000655 [Coemansia sp. BCRC 34301]
MMQYVVYSGKTNELEIPEECLSFVRHILIYVPDGYRSFRTAARTMNWLAPEVREKIRWLGLAVGEMAAISKSEYGALAGGFFSESDQAGSGFDAEFLYTGQFDAQWLGDVLWRRATAFDSNEDGARFPQLRRLYFHVCGEGEKLATPPQLLRPKRQLFPMLEELRYVVDGPQDTSEEEDNDESGLQIFVESLTLADPSSHLHPDDIGFNLRMRRLWLGTDEGKAWDAPALDSLLMTVMQMVNL